MMELQKKSTELSLDQTKVDAAIKIGAKWTGSKDLDTWDFALALKEIEATQEEFDKVFKKGITGEYGNYYKLTPLIVCVWIRDYRKSLIKAPTSNYKKFPESNHRELATKSVSGIDLRPKK